ncbi:hypothetical protein BFF78_10865 [Streptomyces fodineus]|uniref:Secreted protein n=1 Tax=Streptomyces fodineus TaxID=1904616 RepID=A0A1D7Y781_9ACTN|nr:hypothetical protein [Streptomyces fodineus]AOR31478.1 hypothetical protein BFF78_10865 [Streptomyces fodineus]
MFRGTTARTALASIAVSLLALLFFAHAETFAPAHTIGEAQAKAESGITAPAKPARDGADTLRTPGCPDAPAGLPEPRDRQRCPAAGCAQAHPHIAGRAAGTSPSPAPGTAHDPASRVSRAHTPAALQVFRC